MIIGLISDTHGLLRPEALAALQGCDHIVHAGDVGKPEVLDALRAIAPLTVVYGNIDLGKDWAQALPHTAVLTLGGIGLLVTHERKDVPEVLPPGVAVVVTGHSHKPSLHEVDGVLFINPGSAGPRRFRLPIGLALVQVADASAQGQLVTL